MSEIDATSTAEAGTSTEDSFKAPATQEDLDRIVQARLAKERAKYSDYEELKGASAKLREIELANQTELEKAVARAEAAEQKLTATAFDAMKSRVAAKYQIDEEDVELFLLGKDEETLTKQAERLASKKTPETPPEEKHEPTRIGFGVDLKERPDSLDNSSDDDLARQIFGI